MSSRSLGLFAEFFVSQGRSSPASWRLISSGSSVRKRIRPCSRTLSGRFSIFRSRSELITIQPEASDLAFSAYFYCNAGGSCLPLSRLDKQFGGELSDDRFCDRTFRPQELPVPAD